jgi:hypothetical protein
VTAQSVIHVGVDERTFCLTAGRVPLASIVSAAIDVVLATPAELPARVALLEAALQKNERAAEALAAARSALRPTTWTEQAIVAALSAKLRPTAMVTKTQIAAIQSYVGSGLHEDELTALLGELKTAKGPRAIGRRIATYDSAIIGLIIAALTD